MLATVRRAVQQGIWKDQPGDIVKVVKVGAEDNDVGVTPAEVKAEVKRG